MHSSSHGRRWLRLWVGLGISGLLLTWVFQGIEVRAVTADLAGANLGALAVVSLMSAAGGAVRALRWRLLLQSLDVDSGFHPPWASLNIGFMVNNLFPGRLGELVRALVLSRMTPVRVSGIFGTLVAERILDVGALLILGLSSLWSPALPEIVDVAGTRVPRGAFAVVAGLVLVAMFGLPYGSTRRTSWESRSRKGTTRSGIVERFMDASLVFLKGLEALRHPGSLLKALGWSLLLWLWLSGSVWIALSAFDIRIGFLGAVLTQCVIAAFVALPAAPAFVGTLQAGVVVSLVNIFRVPPETALAFAVGYHLAIFIPGTLIGLFHTWSEGVHIGKMIAAARDPEPN